MYKMHGTSSTYICAKLIASAYLIFSSVHVLIINLGKDGDYLKKYSHFWADKKDGYLE